MKGQLDSGRKLAPLPLVRPELTEEDVLAVRAVLARRVWHAPELAREWEQAWEARWEREAVVFATPRELLEGLGRVAGWEWGMEVWADPLLPPLWREGWAGVGSRLRWVAWSPERGNGEWGAAVGAGVRMVRHHQGLPLAVVGGGFVIEEIAELLHPWPGSGWGEVQVAGFDGNRMVQGGGGAVLLTRDAGLSGELRRVRVRLPAAVTCALGVSQLRQLDRFLERRAELAAAYLGLRSRGRFTLPELPVGGRSWDGFTLGFADSARREELQRHLNRSRILAAPPVWYAPPGIEDPGLRHHLECSLGLPFYAGLEYHEQKRVINRVHRWAEGD